MEKILSIRIPNEFKKYIKSELFFFTGISNSKVFQGLDAFASDGKDELYSKLKKRITNKKIIKALSYTFYQFNNYSL